MPVSYLNGKIYSITCLLTDKIYIGCTAQEHLGKRITTHISSYQRWKNNGKNYCSSYEVLKHDSYAIKIIEYVPCTSKQELEERETWYIRNTPNCINKCKSCLLSLKEYQRQYHQAWHQKNKEQQQIYHKIRYQQKKNEKISQCNIDDNEAD
jgi:uncharacterized protein (DUF2344 family)